MDTGTQLWRQLLFIRLSCRNYDGGYVEEAIRIAVALRVLFHHNPKSNSYSLIEQLGVGSSLHLSSNARQREPGEREQGLKFSLDGILSLDGIEPQLGSSRSRSISFAEWWSEAVFTLDEDYSRQDIVRAAANKDGGAHVDPQPKQTDHITRLREGIGTLELNDAGRTVFRALNNTHFHLLRQFGYEVLHSPELLALIPDTRNFEPACVSSLATKSSIINRKS